MIKVTDRLGDTQYIHHHAVIRTRFFKDPMDGWTGWLISLSDGANIFLTHAEHDRFLAAFEMKARR